MAAAAERYMNGDGSRGFFFLLLSEVGITKGNISSQLKKCRKKISKRPFTAL